MCLEMVLQLFMNLHIIRNYVNLAIKWKLHGVSTYLPNLEVLCLEHV